MKRILFVCLGNICRSAAAEEIMRTYLKQEGLEMEIEVDSAGISGYHEGDLADPRMRMHASRRGYQITHHSRPVRTDDFTTSIGFLVWMMPISMPYARKPLMWKQNERLVG